MEKNCLRIRMCRKLILRELNKVKDHFLTRASGVLCIHKNGRMSNSEGPVK